MEELAGRLAAAERERDALDSQLRSEKALTREAAENAVTEAAAAAARAEGLQRQVRRLEEEASAVRQERAKLQGAIADLEQRFSTASSELATTKHHAAEEARLSSEQYGAQLNSLRAQLADARDRYERAAREVEALLSAQEELGAKVPSRGEEHRRAVRVAPQGAPRGVDAPRAAQRRAVVAARRRRRARQLARRDGARGGGARGDGGVELKAASDARAAMQSEVAQLRAQERGWAAERKALHRQLRSDGAVAAADAAAAEAARVVRRKKEKGAKEAAASEVSKTLEEAKKQKGSKATKALAVAAAPSVAPPRAKGPLPPVVKK